jgi:diaminopimelate decarboxylase
VDHFHLKDGVLHCEDVPLPNIAEAVGTPTYVYSSATIRRHARIFAKSVAGRPPPLVCFAVKANPNGAVLATLAKEGFGADIVSIGEYRRAVRAGMDPKKIIFSGVGKTRDEMIEALTGGLYQFNLESAEEADMLSEVATGLLLEARIAFRINPDVDSRTHSKISTGAAQNKFGIPLADAPSAYARARELPGLKVQGVAVHIGSQLTDLTPLESALGKVGTLIRTLRQAGHSITDADLGGGLGVPYDPARTAPPSPEDYGALVAAQTKDWSVRLAFEPGRLIVGNAGVLLSRVIRVKPGPTDPFTIVDAGMNDLIRPALYDAYHEIEAVKPNGAMIRANIVGPVCETGDTFATHRRLSKVVAGDYLVFRTAGAYAAAMSSTYNSRTFAAEVMVHGDQWAVVRERQSFDELLAAEKLPVWLGEHRAFKH